MTLYYTKDHEWIRVEGNVGTIGISDFAQSQLGDVVFVEVPEPGKKVAAGGELAVVESVKAASEVFAPASGTVTEGNAAITENPSLVNSDPMGEGWFAKIKIENPAELSGLMDQAAYDAFVKSLG